MYGVDRAYDIPLLVSGAKGNIGYLEAAAGVGRILSAVLALSHIAPGCQLRENAKVVASVSGSPNEFPLEVRDGAWSRGRLSLVGGGGFG
mmetsp:Transcript_26743/g.50073  ORF Transcript_26743/g.50073 Transcript_26743/m.50073 type:complete len:90 (-) Transcript_26743:765-1034(-)